jgi:hypothetical protein
MYYIQRFSTKFISIHVLKKISFSFPTMSLKNCTVAEATVKTWLLNGGTKNKCIVNGELWGVITGRTEVKKKGY